MKVRIYKQEDGRVTVGVFRNLHTEGRTKMLRNVEEEALGDTLRTLVQGIRVHAQSDFLEGLSEGS